MMNQLTVETEDTFATLLELAANNDIDGFMKLIEHDPCSVDEVGLWYGRQKGSNQMVLEHKTPLMVASIYGSLDVLKLILSLSKANVNRSSGVDKTTALHCAASGGSSSAVDVVKLLLVEGADPNLVDANGFRPVDMIVVSSKFLDMKITLEQLLGTNSNKREYPVDPSLPDIKNGIYSTDEFRIFSFKVRPCSRAYSHDWTECPFVHPGENARRRDPRKYHYSCVPCPDFRKGTCRRGDMCEYAHGVFESWLHPAQYRTRLCKDGITCNRRVCFFAHTQDELRPLYVSTASARASALDFASTMSLIPGSPSFTPPMSPSANGVSNWSNPNVPSLNLPVSNLQSSRLSSSPRFSDQSVFSPRNSSSVFNQFQLMSPRGIEPISPMSSRVSMLARENRSGAIMGSPVEPWSKWGGKPDWAAHADEFGEEPDLSWVQSLVKETPTPHEMKEAPPAYGGAVGGSGGGGGGGGGWSISNTRIEQMDQTALSAWIEQMQLDHLVAQQN